MNKLIFIELIYLLTSPSASVASWWTLLPHHLQRALELSIRSKLYHIISVIIFLFHLMLQILLFTIVLSLILEICYILRSLYFFRFRFRAHAYFIHCVKNYLLVGITCMALRIGVLLVALSRKNTTSIFIFIAIMQLCLLQ